MWKSPEDFTLQAGLQRIEQRKYSYKWMVAVSSSILIIDPKCLFRNKLFWVGFIVSLVTQEFRLLKDHLSLPDVLQLLQPIFIPYSIWDQWSLAEEYLCMSNTDVGLIGFNTIMFVLDIAVFSQPRSVGCKPWILFYRNVLTQPIIVYLTNGSPILTRLYYMHIQSFSSRSGISCISILRIKDFNQI